MENSILKIIADYNEALDVKSAAEKALDAAKATVTKMRDELAAAMVEEEIPKITHAGYSFSVGEKIRYSKKGDEDGTQTDTFFQLLREEGLGGIIKETVNAQTLQSTMAGLVIDNDGDLPNEFKEFINVFSFMDITRRKAAKK